MIITYNKDEILLKEDDIHNLRGNQLPAALLVGATKLTKIQT